MSDEQQAPNPKVQEYWQGFPEAPVSDSFKWVDGEGFEHLTTIRGWSGQTTYQSVSKMIAHITETGGKPVNQRPPMAPAPTYTEASPAPVSQGTPAATTGEAVPPAPNGQPWMTMNINRMVIMALPDNLYTLELYQSGHKYADLKVSKRKLEVIAGYVKHITSADVSKPQDMGVNAVAYYCNGKAKDGGGFWLDLHHLRPA